MPRTARIKEINGIFHIYQRCCDKRQIFRDQEDRDYFISLLKRTQMKFDCQIHGYCIEKPNEYHLLLSLQGQDLSSVMKSINIGYAMYRKHSEPLFKDRYHSELIPSMDDLNHKITKLEPEGVFLTSLADLSSSEEKICTDCLQSYDQAQRHLQHLLLQMDSSIEELLKDKRCRNELIRDFRKQSTLSLKEIGKLFGGISESGISKIVNNFEIKEDRHL